MKKIFTLISAMLVTFSLFAQQNETSRWNYGQSKITISSLANRQVKILVDGKNYSSRENDNDITINDLKAGYHTIKIYQQKNSRSNGRNNKNMQVVYDATVYIRPQYHFDIIINRFGKAFIDERQMNAEYYANTDEGYNNHSTNNNSYSQAMNSHSFEQFKQTLRNENFDNTRLVIAKQMISANYFSAAQVKEMIQLFSFEDSKLETAKYAYRYTTDKNNYFMLNDAFAYSSSKEDLARYIGGYK